MYKDEQRKVKIKRPKLRELHELPSTEMYVNIGQLGSPLVGSWPLVWTKNEVLKYAGFFSPGFSFSNVGTWGGGEKPAYSR